MKGILYYSHTSRLLQPMSETNTLFQIHIKNSNITAIFQNHKYCGIIGNVPIVRFIYGNDYLTHYMINQGIVKADIIHSSQVNFTLSTQGAILKYVLQPTTLVLTAMKSFFPNYQYQQFIAFHLRTGGSLSDIADPSKYLDITHVENAISFMKSQQTKNSSTTILLVSDSSIVKDKARIHLNKSRLIVTSSRVVIVDTQLGTSNQTKQLLSAVAELMLLGHSHTCYGTSISTFSHIGCCLNGKVPWLIGQYTDTFAPIPPSYCYV